MIECVKDNHFIEFTLDKKTGDKIVHQNFYLNEAQMLNPTVAIAELKSQPGLNEE